MELVDVRALGARAERRGGSTPPESIFWSFKKPSSKIERNCLARLDKIS